MNAIAKVDTALAYGRARRTLSKVMRAKIEAAIERLVDLLDTADGDPDLEPALGWTNPGASLGPALFGAGDDREQDVGDEAELMPVVVRDDQLDMPIEPVVGSFKPVELPDGRVVMMGTVAAAAH